MRRTCTPLLLDWLRLRETFLNYGGNSSLKKSFFIFFFFVLTVAVELKHAPLVRVGRTQVLGVYLFYVTWALLTRLFFLESRLHIDMCLINLHFIRLSELEPICGPKPKNTNFLYHILPYFICIELSYKVQKSILFILFKALGKLYCLFISLFNFLIFLTKIQGWSIVNVQCKGSNDG